MYYVYTFSTANGLSMRTAPPGYEAVAGELVVNAEPGTAAALAELEAKWPGCTTWTPPAPPPALDAPTLAAALIAKGVIAQADLDSAVQAQGGPAIVAAVAAVKMVAVAGPVLASNAIAPAV